MSDADSVVEDFASFNCGFSFFLKLHVINRIREQSFILHSLMRGIVSLHMQQSISWYDWTIDHPFLPPTTTTLTERERVTFLHEDLSLGFFSIERLLITAYEFSSPFYTLLIIFLRQIWILELIERHRLMLDERGL